MARLNIYSILRYFRLVVNTVAYYCHRSIPPPLNPTLCYRDVTVIIPTISRDLEELEGTLRSILEHNVLIIVACVPDNYEAVQALCKTLSLRISTLRCREPNKRHQVCKAILRVKTKITVLADDDVRWGLNILPWLLAPLEYASFGGVGTSQRARRYSNGSARHTLAELSFNFLGACYLARRNFETRATHMVDGGTSCMSGRTVAIRTSILQDPDFIITYTTERWIDRILNADDDNFITRWLHRNKWKTWVQNHPDCWVETVLENNSVYLRQCLRWARSNWRSNLKSMLIERYIVIYSRIRIVSHNLVSNSVGSSTWNQNMSVSGS